MHPSRMSYVLMERRQADRIVTDRPGKLLFGDREVDCVVKDLSDGGAGLTVNSADRTDLPRDFAIRLEGETLSRPCHLVWAKGDRLGVAFSAEESVS